MSKAAKTGDESTQEIDVAALRDSLRDSLPDATPDAFTDALNNALPDSLRDSLERTRAGSGSRDTQHEHDTAPPFRAGRAVGMVAIATSESVPVVIDDNVDPADIESLHEDDDEEMKPSQPRGAAHDPTPSMIGTLPGHDVAQALRAMMGEVPDYVASYRSALAAEAYFEKEPPSHGEVTPNFDLPQAFDSSAYPDAGSNILRQTSPDDEPGSSLDDGDTQTRLPEDVADALRARDQVRSEDPHDHAHDHDSDVPPSDMDDDRRRDHEALPSFALEEDEGSGAAAPSPSAEHERVFDGSFWRNDPAAPSTTRALTEPRALAPPTLRRADPREDESTGITRALPYTPRVRQQTRPDVDAAEPRRPVRGSETTAVYDGPVPRLARRSTVPEPFEPKADADVPASSSSLPHLMSLESTAVGTYRRDPTTVDIEEVPPSVTIMARTAVSTAPTHDGEREGERERERWTSHDDETGRVRPDTTEEPVMEHPAAGRTDELPRFSLASIPEALEPGADAATSPSGWPAASTDAAGVRAAFAWASMERDVLEGEVASEPKITPHHHLSSPQAMRPSDPELGMPPPPTEAMLEPSDAGLGAAAPWDSDRDPARGSRTESREVRASRPESRGSRPDSREARASRPGSMDSIDVRMSSPSIDTSAFDEEVQEDPTAVGVPAAHTRALETEPPEALEFEEILPDEIVEGSNLGTSPPPKQSTYRPPVARAEAPAFGNNPDAEERELLEERRFGPLIAVYRQRLGLTEAPNKQAALLLKIASVYETGLQDLNEAFQTLVEAFEIAPSNEDVVTAVDRVGKEVGRMGELADRVKKKLVPGAPDDKRVVFLGHLVYWYERVLGRGSEVSSFVSDIERHDRVHPVVLKRAAQIAAMNDDTKTQREHLLRAIERTVRREEKVALHLALSSAYAGTPDALKHYQLALEIDPTSIVALQGVKRLGKEKEQYAQVQWALERQAEVAPTESERIDALLELAELQETKFLKRELAADLLERVLELEPSQPAALKGLERCYHALRDWPKLACILGVRSEHTFDKKQKVELLELAAEVHESKLGDPAGAVEIYTNLLVVDPKHRRALGDLARLYEKLGDWPSVATYKAQLADLAPTKRASSQELVKLGDFLSAPERDPIAAKLQYERAVVVDPTNAAAWEVIQKLAAADGDIRRVIECLEQRKKHTDVPRQRALVLVELANVHLERGDEDAAQTCFEAAIRADSSNEAAAIAMLDHYTASERWGEAAPLCELLVNAAVRDRDGEALFIRLRLATRIAAALGDADRATTSAIAALDARPMDPGAQADLIAVCAQSPASGKRAKEHLTRIAEESEELAIDVIVRLAGILRDAGDLDEAASTFERARRMDPEDRDLSKDLADVYLQQGDFPRACKLKIDLARSAPTADERFNLLVETGEIWARRADELEKGASIFEEARAIKPRDPWLLQTLMWLYGELGDWDTLSQILEEIVQIHEKPEDKLKTLIAMAEVVRDKLNDRVRAAELFDDALDIDKKRLDLFEEVVRTLTEDKNWEKLERSYRRMIARVKDDDESQLQFLLFHQLGLIYRDRLGDASRAYDSLDAASRLRPDDPEIRRIVIELLVVTDNLDNAAARLRDSIERDPHEPQLYAELYEVFLRQHSFDKAWCTVNVLSRLREPTPEQRRFHEDYAPMPLDRVPGQIVEQAWQSHVFHADLEAALTNLFALMTPAVARLRFGQLRPEQRVGRPFTPTHSRMHDAIRMTFDNAAEILAVTAPELLLGDPKAPWPFAPALAPFGSISVAVPQVEAQSSSLIYLVGKRLAEQRPELAARAFFPSVPDLASLLGTAVRVSRNEVAKDAAGAALDASFAAILTPQERDGIRSLVLQATSDGAPLDVKRWSHMADLSSMRAALLLCGDVEPARDSIQADTATASDLSTREKVGELYKFATSDLYSDLRGAIGVAVQG
jgi:tetratricopeptide (TPR) repeat protein